MPRVVRFVWGEPPVSTLNERRVTVAKLVCNNLQTVAVLEGLHRVAVSPVVERSTGEFENNTSREMFIERSVLGHREELGIVGEALGVIRENLPRPELGRSDNAVPPNGFPSPGVDGLGLQVNVSSRQSFDYLPLDAAGCHKSLDRPVRHGQRTDESFRLHAVKPARGRGIRCGAVDVSHDVRLEDVAPGEPLTESRQRGVVPVLRGARAGEPVQEVGNRELGELRSGIWHARRDHAAHLCFVLRTLRRPFIKESREIGSAERRHENVQCPELVRIVDRGEFRLALNDESERGPHAIVLEGLDHSVDIVRDVRVSRTTREDARSAIAQGDARLEPIGALRSVRHGRKATSLATYSAT